MAKPVTFNVQRLIAAVATEHRLLFKPDDVAFAIVTMNRPVLEESLDAIRAVVAEDLAQFKQTAQWAHSRAESAIEAEVRRSATALREELQSDINTARLRAAEIVQEVRETFEKPMQVKAKIGFVQKGILKATTVHQELRVVRRMLNVAVRKKFLFANPCAGVEFPARVEGLFRPHYVTWSEQQKIEFSAPEYLRNVIRIITETGLRIYKELTPMKKDQLDLENRTLWIPDSKTPSGIAEVPLTDIAADAFRRQLALSGPGPYLFPSDVTADGYQKTFKTVWHATLRRAGVRYFRLYDLRSTYATRLSAGGVADEWVTQLLRQGDAKVFKKYSQMKLQMKREALTKINRQANESGPGFGTVQPS